MAIAGKVVLVTGASRGIGAATALWLARRGACVVAGSRNGSRLAELAAKAADADGEIRPVELDVRREDSVEGAVAEAVSRFGGLDAVVNNAAVVGLGRVEDQEPEDWENVLRTNVIGTLLCCRAAIPALAARGGGTLVNLSSAAADDGFPFMAAYSGSKAAILALSASLRRELRDRRVRVTTVRINNVASEILVDLPAERVTECVRVWTEEGLVARVPVISPTRVAETIGFVIGLDPEASLHDVEIRAHGG